MKCSSFWFSSIYCIFLFLCLLYPSVPLVGAISIRHVVSIIMLFFCLKNGRRNIDWFVLCYSLFLLFYIISGFATGYLEETINTLLGTYLAAIILYISTKIMVVRYNQIKLISLFLLSIFVIDAIVTIGQYYQNPLFIFLPQLLGIDLGDEFMDIMSRRDYQYMESTILAGLFGTVPNGYILSVASILAWYPFRNKYIWINFILWPVCILASFYTQERTGFFLAVTFSLFLLYIKLRSRKRVGVLLLFVFMILAVIYVPDLIETISTTGRYSKGTDGSGRMEYISKGIDFVMNNPLGGVYYFKATNPVMPHFLFVNMFLAGGIVGGLMLLLIVIKQMLMTARYVLKSLKTVNWLPLLFFLMYLDLTGNSLFHNMSIVYGDPLFFVFWGVCACYIGKSYNNKRLYTNNKLNASI